jgi:serine/threonine-protein kinase
MPERTSEVAANQRARTTQLIYLVVLIAVVLIVAWLLLSNLAGDGQEDSDAATGIATVYVPNVVGLDRSEALLALEEAGFDAEVLPLIDEYAVEDTVLLQSPGAGELVAVGVGVTIEVAQRPADGGALGFDAVGADGIRVPDVVGDYRSTAESAIESRDLEPRVSEAYDDLVREGDVVSQSPAAGMMVDVGDEVRIIVSLGKAPTAAVTVPGVLGLSESAARGAAAASGLELYVIPRPLPAPVGIVSEQWPEQGTKVDVGSLLFAVVGVD